MSGLYNGELKNSTYTFFKKLDNQRKQQKSWETEVFYGFKGDKNKEKYSGCIFGTSKEAFFGWDKGKCFVWKGDGKQDNFL